MAGKYGLLHAGTAGHDRQGALEQLLVLVAGQLGSESSRLTINAGVRTENEHIPSFKDQTQFPDALDITFGFKDKIAPRLGFAYDVKGDGKWKTYGSYGWFYDITKLELPRGSFGGDHWVQYFWTLDDPDYTEINCGEGTTGCPGTYIGPGNGYDLRHSSNQVDELFEEYFNRPGMTGIDPNLKPVKTGELTGGIEHELNRRRCRSASATSTSGCSARSKTRASTSSGVEDYLIANPGERLRGQHGAGVSRVPDAEAEAELRRPRVAPQQAVLEPLVAARRATCTAASMATTRVWRAPTKTAASART